MKWILIQVINQDIDQPDVFDTREDAVAEMERRYYSVLEEEDEYARIYVNSAEIKKKRHDISWSVCGINV